MNWVRLAFALLAVGTIYFYNLGAPPLWGDEAGTGIFARNILQFGLPIGFDGRNLTIYDDGAELNANLIVVKLPWLQFYLGALSLHIFGNDTQGLRTLFALAGVTSILPIWAILRTRVPSPLFASTLILITPQVLLFNRNARYYSIVTLLFSLIAWIVCSEQLSKRSRAALCGICMILMFHTHPVAAFTCSVGLMLQSLWQRCLFTPYFIACLIGLGTWLIWYLHWGPTLVAPILFQDYLNQPRGEWLEIAISNLVASTMDIDAVQGLPILAWIFSLSALLISGSHKLRLLCADPLARFIALTTMVHVILVAILFGTETDQHHAVLRYMPHLIAMNLLLLLVISGNVVRRTHGYVLLCVCILATNLPTLSYWNHAVGMPLPLSWWPATYKEIFRTRVEAFEVVADVIHADLDSNSSESGTIAVVPQWVQEVAIFYLGEKFIVAPNITNADIASFVRSKVGQQAFAHFKSTPNWVIYELPQAPENVQGYERIELPINRGRPDDGSRPELTRHTFYENQPLGTISLYKNKH